MYEWILYAGNCMSVSTGPKHAVAIFVTSLRRTWADVYVFSECADFSVREVFRQRPELHEEFLFVQKGELGSPDSAVVVVYRRSSLIERRPARLAAGTPRHNRIGVRGAKVRKRPICQAFFTEFQVNSCHAPKTVTGIQAIYLARVRACRGIKAGDFNSVHRIIRPFMAGQQVVTVGVISAIFPRRFEILTVWSVAEQLIANADHRGLVVKFRVRA